MTSTTTGMNISYGTTTSGTDYYNTVTSMMLGEIYKHNGAWKFAPIGDGVGKDLAGLCAMYGVQTD